MIYDQIAPPSPRSQESCILLKQNTQNEQNMFLKLNILLKVNILLVTKPFQTTETWEKGSQKDLRQNIKNLVSKLQNIMVLKISYCL